MARSVILGNGRLTVGLDEDGLVHDFYYPYVGLDNLTTARSVQHKIGVWVNGTFSWTNDGSWSTNVDFSSEALVSNVVLTNESLGISLCLKDFVDYEFDAFSRIICVKNDSEEEKEVRLFMHQVFEISRGGRADTALYSPEGYLLDYKGHCMLLVSGKDLHGSTFDQYAVGNYGIEGKQGTFMDAEDGELSGHNVEHGGVDSVIRFSMHVQPQTTQKVDYWVIAADTQLNAENIHVRLNNEGLASRLEKNEEYWKQWLGKGAARLNSVNPDHRAMVNKSLMTIKAHTDDRGGIIASCDSSIYNYGRDYYSYVWPRDGCFAIWPLIRLGYTEEPKAFFKFCRDIITPAGYLMHKYQPDRAIGSTWHPLLHNNHKELAIQEDETAIVVVMLGEFYHDAKDDEFIKEMFTDFVVPAGNFMCSFIDEATGLPHASYDLWEEKFTSSTYTAAVVYRALLVAADFADKFGTAVQSETWRECAAGLLSRRQTFVDPDTGAYRKGLLIEPDGSLNFDNTLDVSSLYGVITFGYFTEDDGNLLQSALKQIEQRLLDQSPSGGSPRYEHDNYFRKSDEYAGNPWIISTLWMGQFYVRFRRFDEASRVIEWSKSHALSSGVMPEQVHPSDGSPLSVTPLVWSHAEFINTVLDISHIQKSE